MNAAAGAARGEYRSLRQYQPGDDPRDVHWRSSARRNVPVVREYERDSADTLWLCLDLRAAPGEAAELACEIAATLAARAARLGERFGLATNEIEYQLEETCSRCNCSGAEPATSPVRCSTCNGQGEDRQVRQTILGHTQQGGRPSPFIAVSSAPLACGRC